jgi:hypothetical protein
VSVPLIELIAIFESAGAASAANRELLQRFRGEVETHVSAEFLLHVRVANDRSVVVEEALVAAGARKVTARDAYTAASWMSNQNGRVTGTGVPPGAGDAEAGTSQIERQR